MQDLIGNKSARIRVIPIMEDAIKEMWILDQYRLDADKLKERAEANSPDLPRLKIIPSEDS